MRRACRYAGRPLLVVAARQTAGRGRRGRAWEEAARALAATLAFRPAWPEEAWPRLTLAAGLAACRALGEAVRLEWPNDLVAGGVKVGGLLTEAAEGVVAVGLGVNLYWPEPTVAGAGALCDGGSRVPRRRHGWPRPGPRTCWPEWRPGPAVGDGTSMPPAAPPWAGR